MNEMARSDAPVEDTVEHERSEAEELERIERVQIFASRITKLANESVAKRAPLETRWLADLRQYEGLYDAQTEQAIKDDPTRSGIFANITRRTVNAAEARVIDMLFPTDDKNWGITNTPVPELSHTRKQAQQAGDQETTDAIDAELEIAEKAAEGMEREIDDQLSEADYNGKARDAIHDQVLYGTGILKGAVVVGRSKKRWTRMQDENGQSASVLEITEENAATVQHVSIWNYFPDMNAVTQDDCEYVLERHYMTRKQLSDLRKNPGFFREEITTLLREGANRSQNDNGRMAQMRAISGLESMDYLSNRFEVWEYHGAVERNELIDIGVDIEEDEAADFECVVFVSNNRVIKTTINPMDTDERPYSSVPYQKDESSVFGKGVPWLMRDSQAIYNAAWRTMIENMGLSSGDQIVLDRKGIEPADGSWKLAPRKVWFKKDQNVPVNAAFATFPIASHQPELMNIINAASELSDEETNMPRLMYGENPGASAETMGGMAMQMNQANVVLRRAIKNYDDCITRPLIKRFYDFNMQFSKKEEIKGDFTCRARGSSALLVKEQQAQSLMQLMQLSGQPGFAEITKIKDLYRKVVQAMHLDADDIIKSNDEIEAQQQQMQQQPQDPALAKAQMDMQLAQMKMEGEQQMLQAKMQSDMQVEQAKMQDRQMERQERQAEMQVEREITVAKLSAEQNISIERINADLMKAREKNAADWKRMLAEIQTKARFGSGI